MRQNFPVELIIKDYQLQMSYTLSLSLILRFGIINHTSTLVNCLWYYNFKSVLALYKPLMDVFIIYQIIVKNV